MNLFSRKLLKTHQKTLTWFKNKVGKSWDRVLGVTFEKKTDLILEFSVFLAIKWHIKQCIYITQNELT